MSTSMQPIRSAAAKNVARNLTTRRRKHVKHPVYNQAVATRSSLLRRTRDRYCKTHGFFEQYCSNGASIVRDVIAKAVKSIADYYMARFTSVIARLYP